MCRRHFAAGAGNPWAPWGRSLNASGAKDPKLLAIGFFDKGVVHAINYFHRITEEAQESSHIFGMH